jgi:hypothetical protein
MGRKRARFHHVEFPFRLRPRVFARKHALSPPLLAGEKLSVGGCSFQFGAPDGNQIKKGDPKAANIVN